MENPDLDNALRIFSLAKDYVSREGFLHEVEWQRGLSLDSFTESDLLRESAWVILCGGFRESTIARIFEYFSFCFCDWSSAEEIVKNAQGCRLSASAVFANKLKLQAILKIAERVHAEGFQSISDAIHADPIGQLLSFPFIGKTTVWHLAKNLGLNVAKPDRHLVRLTHLVGFSSAQQLCEAIGLQRNEPASVVDLVLWRYLANTQWAEMSSTQAAV